MLKDDVRGTWFLLYYFNAKTGAEQCARTCLSQKNDSFMSRSVTVVVSVIASSLHISDVLLVAGGKTGKQPRLHGRRLGSPDGFGKAKTWVYQDLLICRKAKDRRYLTDP